MLNLITFSGRLSRFGWLFNLVLIGLVLFYWVWPRLDNLSRLPGPYSLENNLEMEILLGTLAALYVLISSAIRRLRDAGSPLPLLELILGALIPGFGQLWLAIRLFLWGPKKEQHPLNVPATDHKTLRQLQMEREENTRFIEPEEDLTRHQIYEQERAEKVAQHKKRHTDRNAKHAARQEKLNPHRASDDPREQVSRIRKTGATVRRSKRKLFSGPRQIGF